MVCDDHYAQPFPSFPINLTHSHHSFPLTINHNLSLSLSLRSKFNKPPWSVQYSVLSFSLTFHSHKLKLCCINITHSIKLILQELEAPQVSTWQGYVDWKNKPALRGRHGGMLAASFVLGLSQNLLFFTPKQNFSFSHTYAFKGHFFPTTNNISLYIFFFIMKRLLERDVNWYCQNV